MRRTPAHRGLAAACLLALAPLTGAQAASVGLPVLAPLTGFLAAEGASQRNGALLALGAPPPGVRVTTDVSDTGTSPEGAVNAFERAAEADPIAVVAPLLGTQMLALLPLAAERGLPLLTISGTAAITRAGNPWVFRFFPDDATTKIAQVRYALEVAHVRRPAVITQTTAYGQSGRIEIDAALARAGVAPVFEEALDVAVRDMSPVLAKARAAGADGLLLHLHAGPSALLLKAAAGLGLPIVAGSGVSQPSTVALLEPGELAGVCAETNAAPVAAETPAMRGFLDAYRARFHADPDGFALAQYDGTMMALSAVAHGADTPARLAASLAASPYEGLAMTYRSDGRGDMAHAAVIICYDGVTRVPKVVAHYDREP